MIIIFFSFLLFFPFFHKSLSDCIRVLCCYIVNSCIGSLYFVSGKKTNHKLFLKSFRYWVYLVQFPWIILATPCTAVLIYIYIYIFACMGSLKQMAYFSGDFLMITQVFHHLVYDVIQLKWILVKMLKFPTFIRHFEHLFRYLMKRRISHVVLPTLKVT